MFSFFLSASTRLNQISSVLNLWRTSNMLVSCLSQVSRTIETWNLTLLINFIPIKCIDICGSSRTRCVKVLQVLTKLLSCLILLLSRSSINHKKPRRKKRNQTQTHASAISFMFTSRSCTL